MTTFAYDAAGNQTSMKDANNNSTTYQYDQRGRRTQRTLPLGQRETYAYDPNRNLVAKTDFNGRNTTYTYDTMNRLLKKAADPYFVQNGIGAAAVSFTYTHSGKRATMTNASGTPSYTRW